MTAPARVFVYAGPTMPGERLRELMPAAELRPPAARGDLLSERWADGDVAVVIDGYFREQRSVGHKEILALLDQGVRVVGAASMGALRAAELAACGMVGLGEVYRMYADGEIDGDDEVGVLHGPAELGYPAQTVALVSLRFAVASALTEGLVVQHSCDRIIAATKAMPFVHRTWADIEQAVDRPDHEALQTLRAGIAEGTWDVKRRDAESALRTVAAGATPTPVVTLRGSVVTGISRTQRLERESRDEYAPERVLDDLDVLDAARLFDPDYPRWHEQVLGELLDDRAADLGLTPAAHARSVLGVDDDEHLPDALAGWLTADERATLCTADQLRQVMLRVWPIWHCMDWRPAVIARLRSTGRWDEWRAVVIDAEEVRSETRYRIAVPPPKVCGQLFQRHWRNSGSTPQMELGRRGFTTTSALGTAAARFFAYDVSRGRRSPAAAS